jgi:S-formylglutathione hydrolase FrmB
MAILLAPPGPLAQSGTLEWGEITSPALEGNLLGDPATRPFGIYLPPSYQTSERRYPVVYMLHGYWGTAKQAAADFDYGTSRVDSLIQAGQSAETIVVWVDGSNRFNGSMYSSSKTIGDYETYIAKDLVGYIDSHYRTLAHRYTRGITGHSMGGYGAMHLALKYPEVFGAVVAQAGFYDQDLDYLKHNFRDTAAANPQDWEGFQQLAYPANPAIYAMLAAVAPNPDKPPFFLDLPFERVDGQLQLVPAVWARILGADIVHGHLDRYLRQPLRLSGIKFVHGRTDVAVLVIQAHLLDQAMNERSIDHVYVEHPGGHDFTWKEALPFFSDLLRPELIPLREHLLSAEIRLVPMVVGRPTPLEVKVELDTPLESIGDYQQLYLDLSALGSTSEIPLQDQGGGRYTLNYSLTPLQTGSYTLPVVAETSQGEQYKLIIPAAFSVFPAEDLLILEDALAAGWQAESIDGAEPLRFANTGPLYQGSSVSAFQVQLGKSSGWSVKLLPATPVGTFGYSSLHFAFHPGDAKSGTTYLNINTSSGKIPVKIGHCSVTLIEVTGIWGNHSLR